MPNPAPPPPAPPAAPPPTTPASPSPQPAPTDGHPPELADAFKALDALDAPVEPPAPKPPEPPKKADEPPQAPKGGLPPKDGPKPAPAPKTDDLEPPAVRTPKELRDWGKAQAKRAKEKEAEVAQLQERLKTLEARPGPATKEEGAIKERLATLEKQLADRENEIKLFRYEQSNEYKEKYLEPWRRAEQQAYAATKQLEVYQKDEESGELKPVRTGTEADFQGLYHLPLGQALRKAKDLFGSEGASIVVQHWQKLHTMAEDAASAVESYKTQAAEREKTETARIAAENEGLARMWKSVNDSLAEKYAWFRPVDDDEKGNELLAQGYQFADSFFSNRAALTPQQRVILDAQVRNRTAAFPRLVYQLKTRDSEIAALKKELEDFKASSPSAPKRGPDGKFVPQDQYEDWNKALDALPG